MSPESSKRFRVSAYNFGFLDEGSKREIRRSTLKAVAIPGYQVPFASRELPIGKGWGTGGMQLSLSLIGSRDTIKVIDQGHDDSVNAVSIRHLIQSCTQVEMTRDSQEASLIQSRHRIPEIPLRKDQILILQVPQPDPLKKVESHEKKVKQLHADKDYKGMWLHLYEDISQWGDISISADYPSTAHERYLFAPSPLPRWDVPKLNHSEALCLLGAGREKKIYAIPPHTQVTPLAFDDVPFTTENFGKASCKNCGADNVYLDEFINDQTGQKTYSCSDTGYCHQRIAERRIQ
ncbi:alpha-D-ribose 1-methylphosphonate 5-phosphate C-P-lyase PhnJ [Salibacterium aidingense]|uniref:alpha-D-ribose 1-methylphosphonate 5-phosphate C-P-lyase PhnJ n=1 Tax=Salibacterium aidingense TaxID=384933 RepID=UPI003BD55771